MSHARPANIATPAEQEKALVDYLRNWNNPKIIDKQRPLDNYSSTKTMSVKGADGKNHNETIYKGTILSYGPEASSLNMADQKLLQLGIELAAADKNKSSNAQLIGFLHLDEKFITLIENKIKPVLDELEQVFKKLESPPKVEISAEEKRKIQDEYLHHALGANKLFKDFKTDAIFVSEIARSVSRAYIYNDNMPARREALDNFIKAETFFQITKAGSAAKGKLYTQLYDNHIAGKNGAVKFEIAKNIKDDKQLLKALDLKEEDVKKDKRYESNNTAKLDNTEVLRNKALQELKSELRNLDNFAEESRFEYNKQHPPGKKTWGGLGGIDETAERGRTKIYESTDDLKNKIQAIEKDLKSPNSDKDWANHIKQLKNISLPNKNNKENPIVNKIMAILEQINRYDESLKKSKALSQLITPEPDKQARKILAEGIKIIPRENNPFKEPAADERLQSFAPKKK
jgi:hypothetical protein